MADVVQHTGLGVRFGCELYTGRRPDVERLRKRLEQHDSSAVTSRRSSQIGRGRSSSRDRSRSRHARLSVTLSATSGREVA
jgi:hypothetical protein